MIFQIMGKKRDDMERATGSEQKKGRLKRDRGRFSREYWNVIYSRPKVMLRAAEGSITRGREQHEWRPRVDKFLKSFRADILFYPCEVMRRS